MRLVPASILSFGGYRFLSLMRRWLGAVLVLITAFFSMAAGPDKKDPIEPTGRVLASLPYRVIPAHPPLKPKGETLAELGFDSVDALLAGVESRTSYNALAFSPDGRFLVSGASDNTVKLWDLASRELRHTFEGHAGAVWSVVFSPDGRFLASGSWDKTVKLWDVESRDLCHTFEDHAGSVSAVAFSPDGRFLATGADDNTVKLWDVASRKLHHTFEGHSGSVRSVAFSPDGETLASGSYDNTVKLWYVTSGGLLHTIEGHAGAVWSVAFSPDGRFLASGADDTIVKLWHVDSGKVLHTFKGHADAVWSVAFSPDGNFLASGAWDKTVKLWDVGSGGLLHTIEGHASNIFSVVFSPDGRFLASGADDKTVRFWDAASGDLRYTFEGHGGSVSSVAFSPDGHFLAYGADDNTVKLWDVASRQLRYVLEGHAGSVSAVAFSLDGRLLASGAEDNTVKLWDVASHQLRYTFEGHGGSVWSVAFSPESRSVASGADDNTVKLWDVASRKLLHTFKGHGGSVRSVAFSPDGRFMASGANDNTVKLWDMASRELLHTFKGHGGSVRSVAFSPDGRLLASGSDDSTVKLWSAKSRGLRHTFKGRAGAIRSVAFSPDGRFMASGAYDNTVKLWHVALRELNDTFKGHGGSVRSVAFSPNGRFLVSGVDDNTVKLYDIRKKAAAVTLMGGNRQSWLAVDGRGQVLRGDDGTLVRKRSGANGDWQPVRPAGVTEQNSLGIVLDPNLLTVQPGQNSELRVRITNTGRQPAFWLHLKPSASQDNTLRLDPPHNLLLGKGIQLWKQTRIARLDPGENASLHACVTANLKLPASFLASGGRDLEIVLATANGTENIQTLKADLQSPELQWQRALLETDSRTLRLNLVNRGKARLNAFTLNLYAVDETGTDPPAAKLLSQQAFETLDLAGTSELAVVLPEDVNLKASRLELRGRTRELPIFSWALKQPEIEAATRILPWILVVALSVVVLIAVFYLRRYRHPLVVQLSKKPAVLLGLPPEQLAEARARLNQTRRLDTVLSEVEVTAQTLSAAVAFVEKKTPEKKAQWLARRLGASAEAVQPTLWELHLQDTFPLNLDRCLISFPSAEMEPQDLYAELGTVPQTRERATLLIGPDSVYQRKLREKTGDRTNKLAAPRGSDLTELLLSPTPVTVLARILSGQLTLTQLSPYQLGGGVNRESVFFGRQEIIIQIMNRDPANYLVVSGRQLGKSSLLKALTRRYKEHPEVSCNYLALASESLVPRLVTALKLPRDAGLEGIAAHVARSDKRYLFLIDEADKFVRWERVNDYPVLDALRRMSEEGHANFILAGFWELYEHAVLDYQSPLKNFAKIIQLGELEAEACHQLATEPMRNMRLTYADEDLVGQLLRETGQRANLMAIACNEILFQLESDQRVIKTDDVKRALHSDEILKALKGWDEMTDSPENCRIDRIVVYATVERNRFTLSDLVNALKRHSMRIDAHSLKRSLERLELGFVLSKDDAEGVYFYPVPLFRKMLLRDNPQLLLKIELDSPV